jgi:hypothetical protein
MRKLKTWWATLRWWQKGLLALPVGVVALALLVGALWPKSRSSPPAVPSTEIPPSIAAQEVEGKVDAVIAATANEIAAAKEVAADEKTRITSAADFAGVDAILYGHDHDRK